MGTRRDRQLGPAGDAGATLAATAARRDHARGVRALLEPDCLLPVQHRAAAPERTAERELMAAVLEGAVTDVRRYRHACTPRGRQLAGDAAGYLRSNDRAWPFAASRICDVLGIDLDAMRVALGLVPDASSGEARCFAAASLVPPAGFVGAEAHPNPVPVPVPEEGNPVRGAESVGGSARAARTRSTPPPLRRLPDGFTLTEADRQYAIAHGIPPEAVAGECEAFCNHHRAKGSRMAVPSVTNIIQVKCRRDWYQLEWPLRKRVYEVGVYADEVRASPSTSSSAPSLPIQAWERLSMSGVVDEAMTGSGSCSVGDGLTRVHPGQNRPGGCRRGREGVGYM